MSKRVFAFTSTFTSTAWRRNRNLLVPLEGAGVDTRAARWVARLVCGGVELRTVYVQEHQMRLLLLSRLATPRAGAHSYT